MTFWIHFMWGPMVGLRSSLERLWGGGVRGVWGQEYLGLSILCARPLKSEAFQLLVMCWSKYKISKTFQIFSCSTQKQKDDVQPLCSNKSKIQQSDIMLRNGEQGNISNYLSFSTAVWGQHHQKIKMSWNIIEPSSASNKGSGG